MKYIIFLFFIFLIGCSAIDRAETRMRMERDAIFHTESEAVHTEPDTVHVPVWITSNGNVYPEAFKGAIQGTFNFHNDGKPLVLVTNEGKPLILITNNGVPLITNNGPLLPDNQGKPYILFTNDGKPLISFDNQGKPLMEVHFDTGALTKTADNAIYIVATILGIVMLVICGVLVWYIIRKEREISEHKVYAQKMESECRTLKQKLLVDDKAAQA